MQSYSGKECMRPQQWGGYAPTQDTEALGVYHALAIVCRGGSIPASVIMADHTVACSIHTVVTKHLFVSVLPILLIAIFLGPTHDQYFAPPIVENGMTTAHAL